MLTSTNAHTGPRPLPNRLCPQHAPARLPAPISTSNKKRRTEAQNERPVLPQENGRRQTAVQFDPHLPTSRTQDPVDIHMALLHPVFKLRLDHRLDQ